MDLTIFIDRQANPVEYYAAEELKKYLEVLYREEACICAEPAKVLQGPSVIIGDPRNHPWLAGTEWPILSGDGFCLRTVPADYPVLVVAGGSGRGTLFAVYELLEHWGIRFLLSGDVLPEKPEPLRLIGFDECVEPAYPIRATRPMANLPEGSAAWSLSDFTAYIDQAAKLKFNTFVFVIMESGPWLDYDFRGMPRPAGDIFYGYRFPIDEHFIGKELFAGASEFYSPVLAVARDDEERKQCGISLVHSILGHCKSRGLLTILTFSLLEPPTELKHKCNEWASVPLPDPNSFPDAHFTVTPVEEFGVNPQYAAWMNVLDPVVRDLTAHRLRALIETYPEADSYHLWVSEHRAGVIDHQKIIAAFDSKYRAIPDFDFERELSRSDGSPFERERYQNQMKGDLSFLYAFDMILNEEGLLRSTSKPDAALGVAGVMPPLAPLVAKILPERSVFVEFLDYGAHGPADCIDKVVPLLGEGIPISLEVGIHDDNNMYFPQASVESLERIVHATASSSMNGYVAALWQVRQADINGAFLARASIKPATTASEFYRDFFPRLVGPSASENFEKGYRLLEAADREVRKGLLYGYAFPMTDRLIATFVQKGVDREAIQTIRPQFKAVLEHFTAARAVASSGGLKYVDFWIKRTQFAVDWLDLAIASADFGKILGDCMETGLPLAPGVKVAALRALDGLIDRSRSLIELIAGDASHIGDLGQIANLNQHVHRYLLKLRIEITSRHP